MGFVFSPGYVITVQSSVIGLTQIKKGKFFLRCVFNNKKPHAATIKKKDIEIQIETVRVKAIVLPAGNAGILKLFG